MRVHGWATRAGKPPARWVMRRLPGRRVRWGSLRRTAPFSTRYGWDRGTPVDRFYIERHLAAHADAIAGDVLEVRDDAYTRAYGGPRVRSAEVVDIDATNRRATIVADLCDPGSLGQARFDAILLTQVLFLLEEPETALRNAWRALRPGGTLLLTEPCLQRIDPHDPQLDRRRWTPLGFRRWLDASLPGARVQADGRGNVLAAVAGLLGLAMQELSTQELEVDDPAFPLIVCARVDRPSLICARSIKNPVERPTRGSCSSSLSPRG